MLPAGLPAVVAAAARRSARRSCSSRVPTWWWSHLVPPEPAGPLLPAAALRAFAAATHERLGGPGNWLLLLPVSAIAGLQVLCRSLLAGTPATVPGDGDSLADAVARMPAGRRYTALVPTQLRRFLDTDPGRPPFPRCRARRKGCRHGRRAAARARAEGVGVVTTYGMTETAGGCVYDGHLLDGVTVRIGEGAELAGPTWRSATPRSGDGGLFVDAAWFRTRDAGSLDDGRLTLHGRLDDVVISGGANVAPAAVEAALREHPDVADAVVFGHPDPGVGQRGGRRRPGARRGTLAGDPAPVGRRSAGRPRGPAHAAGRRRLSAAAHRQAWIGGRWPRRCATDGHPAQWLAGARPKTLPAAFAPVLVGTGAAIALGGFRPLPALLALVALALQVAVNYANDYSDGRRGTDADRVGPMRLVGSGAAALRQVLVAAGLAFAVAAVAGVGLAALSSWWLVAVGAVCIAAAWTYTGGPLPYGYRAPGEVFVFVFFGLVAVVGTTYAQTLTLPGLAFAVAVPVGLLDGPARRQQPARHRGRRARRQADAGGAPRGARHPARLRRAARRRLRGHRRRRDRAPLGPDRAARRPSRGPTRAHGADRRSGTRADRGTAGNRIVTLITGILLATGLALSA